VTYSKLTITLVNGFQGRMQKKLPDNVYSTNFGKYMMLRGLKIE